MARQTSFYYSFLVLPPDQRRAIVAVWDFCRAVDDAVDEPPVGGRYVSHGPRRDRDSGARSSRRCFEGGHAAHAARRATPSAVRGRVRSAPRPAFEDVIDGVAMDLDTPRYETFDELFEYCRRVASAVGMICIQIFGCRSEKAREYALNLGVALQLTNILRDVTSDLQQRPFVFAARGSARLSDARWRRCRPA